MVKANLILLVGDAFLRAQKTKTIASDIEKSSGGPIAHQSFSVEETAFSDILAAARTLPFFSPGQIIYIRNAEALKETDLAVLAAYLEHPTQQTTLIFEADELKSSAELQKIIKSKGQVFLLAAEEAKQAGASFLQQKLARSQKTMSPGARSRILAMCGDAVMFLDTMLDRLIQYAGEKKEIDEDMVNEFEENWTEMDVFKLTNAFVDRDPSRVVKIFRDLMDFYDADIFSITGILHWQLRQLWQAATLLAQGAQERDICSKLRMHPARLAALRKFPIQRLEAAIEGLYQIDKKSKTGQVEGISSVEAWLLQYAS